MRKHALASRQVSISQYLCFRLRSKRFRGVQPLFLILALAPISRGQKTFRVPFLGLSLLANLTETLAMQATCVSVQVVVRIKLKLSNKHEQTKT